MGAGVAAVLAPTSSVVGAGAAVVRAVRMIMIDLSAFDLYYNQPKFSGISDDTCYSPQGGETSVNAFLSRKASQVYEEP